MAHQINEQLTPRRGGVRRLGVGDIQFSGWGEPSPQWTALAIREGQYIGAKTDADRSAMLAARPAPNAQPADINSWLNDPSPTGGQGISPVYLYPEFGWSVGSSGATAAYDLAPGDHVSWTATPDGAWNYNHTWGGVDVGRALNAIVSTVSILASVSGFVVLAMFLNTAQAVANHEPLSDLAAALKHDWDMTRNSSQLAFAIYTGDWQKAWNAATNYGNDLSGIAAEWAPGPAPDLLGNPTIVQGVPMSGAVVTTGNSVLDSSGKPVVRAGIPRAGKPVVRAGIPRAGGAAGASSPLSTTSTILVGTAAVAGAALLGTYGYARYKHQSYGSVWRQIWQKTGGHVRMPHILGKGKR